jgi:hypothetical protein
MFWVGSVASCAVVLLVQRRIQCGGDRARNLRLYVEDVCRRQFPVVLLGPQVDVGMRIDQLGIDANLVADAAARRPRGLRRRQVLDQSRECSAECR